MEILDKVTVHTEVHYLEMLVHDGGTGSGPLSWVSVSDIGRAPFLFIGEKCVYWEIPRVVTSRACLPDLQVFA